MDKVVKEFTSRLTNKLERFEKTKESHTIDTDNGLKYVRSWWAKIEGDNEVLEFICALDNDGSNIDFNTLNTKCLTGDEEVNKEAVIK